VLLILLGVVLIIWQTPLLQSVNWYQFKPTYFVLWDLKSPSAVDVQRAWSELIARDQAGSLSAGSRDAMVRFALGWQANGPTPPAALDNAVVDYLAARCTAGDLPADQQNKFFDQAVRTSPLVRARVVSGDPLPYGVSYLVSVGSHSNFWGDAAYSDCSIDGKIVGGSSVDENEFSSPGGGFSSTTITNSLPVGKHAFREILHIEIFRGPMRRPPAGAAIFTTSWVLTGSFEVVPAGVERRHQSSF
jgi:hypothetical protein